MIDTNPGLLDQIRDRFAHIDACPFTGERVFFENAGGALTLKSVVEKSAEMAAIPDNQGRDNPASHALVSIIEKAREDMRVFFNAPDGHFFVGESGTELLFRLISVAVLGTPEGRVVGSSLEHPATRSACDRWSKIAGKPHVIVAHDNETGSVGPAAYEPELSSDTRVATILHTSPVTGMGVDVAAIAREIRKISPDCFIIVDGIQHAAHGRLDIQSYDIDAYVVSPYKVFSRHGYGLAWISDRFKNLPHDCLLNAPGAPWEMGTRDTGAYATFSEVVRYFEWLGSNFTDEADPRAKIVAAGEAIHAQEAALTDAMIHGTGNLPGLADMPSVTVLGGNDNPLREGLVAMTVDGIKAPDVVAQLRDLGIRTHTRKADHYSGNILDPLELPGCIRVSMCHYNSKQEVAKFLSAMQEITATAVAAE